MVDSTYNQPKWPVKIYSTYNWVGITQYAFVIFNFVGLFLVIIPTVTPLLIGSEDSCLDAVSDVHYNAEIAWTIVASAVYLLGIFGTLSLKKTQVKKEKRILLVHMIGMGVVILWDVGLRISEIIDTDNREENYIECETKQLHNFDETNTKDYRANFFAKHKCCSPTENLADFWSGISWGRSGDRTQNLANIPVQCCKSYEKNANINAEFFDSDDIKKCLDSTLSPSTDEYRHTRSCWEEADVDIVKEKVWLIVWLLLFFFCNILLLATARYIRRNKREPEHESEESFELEPRSRPETEGRPRAESDSEYQSPSKQIPDIEYLPPVGYQQMSSTTV